MKPMPENCTQEHLDYLDLLCDTGSVNMFGARPHLAEEFALNKQDSAAILSYWMETFSDRHPA